jgi:putative two-component system response regulator
LNTADKEAELAQLETELKANLAAPAADTPAFLEQASQRLRSIPFRVAPDRRVACLTEIAWQYYHHGQRLFSAVEPIALAVMLARQEGLRPLLRRALSIQGAVLVATNNPTDALRSLLEALDISHELKDIVAVTAAWNNIGSAFHEAALFSDARACFERAASFSMEAPDHPAARQIRSAALANAAMCSLQLLEYERGIESVARAIEALASPRTPEELAARVLAEATYTRLLVGLDRPTEAAERANVARAMAPEARSLRADVAASCSVGLVEVYNGQADIGISRMMSALEKARVIQSSLREALQALVQAYERSDRPDRALSTHRELIMLIRKAQQNAILKSQELHLERLELPHVNPEEYLKEKDDELRARMEAVVRGPSPEQMLEQLALTVEMREESNGEHAFRVGKLAAMLAKVYGLAEEQCGEIEKAARLHDIGKVVIPDTVIRKRKALNDGEWQIIRTHAQTGAELIGKSRLPYAMLAEEIARYHHERWGGEGYPEGLSGGAIPLAARMVALADAFDALIHERPYRRSFTIEEALGELARGRGKQFDPYLTDLFIPMVRQFYEDNADADEQLAAEARAAPFSEMRRRVEAELARGVVSSNNRSS